MGAFSSGRPSGPPLPQGTSLSCTHMSSAYFFGDGDGEGDFTIGFLLVADGGDAGTLNESQVLGQCAEEAPHVWGFWRAGSPGGLGQKLLYVPLGPGHGEAPFYNDGNDRQLLLLLGQL